MKSPMLHTKFRENQPAGSGEEDFWGGFTIYGHGGHLGHVTRIMLRFFHFLVTGVIQKVLPALSTETLLHIWLLTEYYGFRPSSTAVDTGTPRV